MSRTSLTTVSSAAAGLCLGGGQYGLMPAELGESLAQILDQIEELGVDEFPPEMEQDLRRAMMLPLTPTFPFSEASIEPEGYSRQTNGGHLGEVETT